MSQFAIDGKIINGHLEVDNLPFPDNSEVRIFVVPKVDLSKMSFQEAQELTQGIKGNLSDDIDAERGER